MNRAGSCWCTGSEREALEGAGAKLKNVKSINWLIRPSSHVDGANAVMLV